ncbi:uncharacterized protein [Palaemon carinicauda]|uniref:uncharacterized protein n=1 Tax=Palaemon carinicauda TaxID=392227 RepID=UPI0035B5A71B
MLPLKKLGGRSHLQAAVEPVKHNHTGFYIHNASSGKRFLVDTAATLSTYLLSKDDHGLPSDDRAALVTANGRPITCYRTRTLKISIMGRDYSWPFLIADVKVPLLGADFIGHHGSLVDVCCKRLFDQGPYMSHNVSCRPRVCSVTSHNYGHLLQEFPDVLNPELRQLEGVPANHRIYHYITMDDPPTNCKFRRVPPQKLQDAKCAFLEMERMGICKKASSPWAFPLHMVKKPEGSWSPCGGYRRLNLAMMPDHYPLANM